MKFITVSGIDKSGKTTIIDAFMKATNYQHYVVDRDPSNYVALSHIQERNIFDSDIILGQFSVKFSPIVDLAILLTCDIQELKRRFEKTNEPKLPGKYNFSDHQDIIKNYFYSMKYKNSIEINTTNITVDTCVRAIKLKLFEIERKAKCQ